MNPATKYYYDMLWERELLAAANDYASLDDQERKELDLEIAAHFGVDMARYLAYTHTLPLTDGRPWWVPWWVTHHELWGWKWRGRILFPLEFFIFVAAFINHGWGFRLGAGIIGMLVTYGIWWTASRARANIPHAHEQRNRQRAILSAIENNE